MKTIETIELLRIKREAAKNKMNDALKSTATEKEFDFWCKELQRIDEQIKSIKLN